MANKANHLDKGRVLGLISEARELVELYDAQNKRDPNQYHNYGTVDDVALNLFERGECVIVIGVKLRQGDINIHTRKGYATSGDITYISPETDTYVLKDFEGTTIARFTNNLCETLIERANNGSTELKEIMMDNVVAYAKRTQKEIALFL